MTIMHYCFINKATGLAVHDCHRLPVAWALASGTFKQKILYTTISVKRFLFACCSLSSDRQEALVKHSQPSAKQVPRIYQACTNYAPSMYQATAKHAPSMYQECTKHLPNKYQECTKHLPKKYQECTKHRPSKDQECTKQFHSDILVMNYVLQECMIKECGKAIESQLPVAWGLIASCLGVALGLLASCLMDA